MYTTEETSVYFLIGMPQLHQKFTHNVITENKEKWVNFSFNNIKLNMIFIHISTYF